jgi:hypothetical protein
MTPDGCGKGKKFSGQKNVQKATCHLGGQIALIQVSLLKWSFSVITGSLVFFSLARLEWPFRKLHFTVYYIIWDFL